MARCTKFIGLSPKAKEFLTKYNSKELCRYHMTEGMFDESLMGGIYEVTLQRKGIYSYPGNIYYEDYKATFIEVVQAEIWSGGPCIFTCLENIRTKEVIELWTDEELNQY